MLTFSAYLIKLLLISFHNKCRTHKFSSKICILVHAAKCRVFSHDVTAAILVSQNNETAALTCWRPELILWELNSFLMQTLSFVPINLRRCWPRECKHSIDSNGMKNQSCRFNDKKAFSGSKKYIYFFLDFLYTHWLRPHPFSGESLF